LAYVDLATFGALRGRFQGLQSGRQELQIDTRDVDVEITLKLGDLFLLSEGSL
jgi:hypothetical protein